eukprot:CAMPEP_0170548328 /NCGR_PEP_ID=MMETSP0211-20121228/6656_1 /TAXON_ID=311385 /ORGANISM="Pseudokeronopsis sp., Strain OXSARD2" /LENGTH=82 /DNA_ID=CAMNT_0010853821 /DNA_START=195 /DNA_END=443 /DNA_ORIENTATION=-
MLLVQVASIYRPQTYIYSRFQLVSVLRQNLEVDGALNLTKSEILLKEFGQQVINLNLKKKVAMALDYFTQYYIWQMKLVKDN